MPHGHGALWLNLPQVQVPMSAPCFGGTQEHLKAGTSLQAESAGGCLPDPLIYISHSFSKKHYKGPFSAVSAGRHQTIGRWEITWRADKYPERSSGKWWSRETSHV